MRTNFGTPPSCTTMFVTLAPMSTTASGPERPSESRAPATRSTANGVRSTVDTLRPARCAARIASSTASWDAATSRPRTMRAWSVVTSSRATKSSTASSTGMGTRSATWNLRHDLSSSAGIHGRSTRRTTTFWFETPSTTSFLVNLAWLHNVLIASPTASGSTTSPSRTTPGGRATWPKRSRTAFPFDTVTCAARTLDVPMSSPMAVRPATVPTSHLSPPLRWSSPWVSAARRPALSKPGGKRSTPVSGTTPDG